jgi:hypothetical protein
MSAIDWATLVHAYGSASDIPALLADARNAAAPLHYKDEPWFTLWSSLYHQDDVYSASFAAVPELIAIVAERPDLAVESLFLAASIELRRNEAGAPELPAALTSVYQPALETGRVLATELAARSPNAEGKLVFAELVFSGEFARARAILDAGDAE